MFTFNTIRCCSVCNMINKCTNKCTAQKGLMIYKSKNSMQIDKRRMLHVDSTVKC